MNLSNESSSPPSTQSALQALERIRHSADGARETILCPSHDDHHPSLSIRKKDGLILLHCFAKCPPEAIVKAIGLDMRDLFADARRGRNWRERGGPSPAVKSVTPLQSPGLTLAELAKAKRLPKSFLREELGLTEITRNRSQVVRIPYFGPDGDLLAVRFRISLDGPRRFDWRTGNKPVLYGLGLDHVKAIRETGWVLLVEGESDCWTAWHHGIPALGIPGKATWHVVWHRCPEPVKELLKRVRVYLWQEPDATDLPLHVSADLPDLFVIRAPKKIKDLSDAHLRLGGKTAELVHILMKKKAIPAARWREQYEQAREAERQRQTEAQAARLRQEAASVLAAPDPLILAAKGLRALGYGGDLRPALIVYLAATSRLLKMRRGSMPVHTLLVGIPGTGKSYTLKVVLALLPAEAYHEIDAGSPRVLIYDDADLRHRLVIFGEADSLPAGEDNPAASAVRTLLQDHHLRYKVVVRDSETGQYVVQDVDKPGPSVLITTAIKRLKPQLDSRLFSLEVPEDVKQVRAALKTQASIELDGYADPDPALIAYQGYVQALAPWDVVVPFAERLSKEVGRSLAAPRIIRDLSRLHSLIKAVTILRHKHRQQNAKGRWVATVADYRTVYTLVKEMYEATVTGASKGVREAVEAVRTLLKKTDGPVTVTMVAKHLGINKMAASRRVHVAIKNEWLINKEERKGYPAILEIGEPLPTRTGLPHPDTLKECNGVTRVTGRGSPPSPLPKGQAVDSPKPQGRA